MEGVRYIRGGGGGASYYEEYAELTALAHLGDVPRDGGADELGELVFAHLTPLGIIASLTTTTTTTTAKINYTKNYTGVFENKYNNNLQ